jgi:hypothetical protein
MVVVVKETRTRWTCVRGCLFAVVCWLAGARSCSAAAVVVVAAMGLVCWCVVESLRLFVVYR